MNDRDRSSKVQNARLFTSLAIIALVFVALIITTGYLIIKLYMTTTLLVDTTKKSFIQDTKSKCQILDEFFVQRQNDIESLSSSSVFSSYYHSKSLGMSKEYGLSALASLIEEELENRVDSIKDSGQQVFLSGVYFDYESMEPLAKSGGVVIEDLIDHKLFEKSSDSRSFTPKLETVCDSSVCRIFISKPVVYEQLNKGLLVLEISHNLVSQKVHAPDAYSHSSEVGLADENGKLVIGAPGIVGKSIWQIFAINQHEPNNEIVIDSKTWDPMSDAGQSNLFLGKLNDVGWFAFKIIPGSVFGRGPSSSVWMMWFFLFVLSVALLIILVMRSWRLRNQMYKQLKDAHDKLETRVEERTAELASTNTELLSEIRERKQAQKTLYQQAQVLSSITDSILIISKDMKIIYANQTAKDIFDLEGVDKTGDITCFGLLKHESDVCDECPVVSVLRDGKAHKAVTNYFNKGGSELWVYNNAFPYYDDSGELLGSILLSTDYSIRKEIEKALSLAKEHAEAASVSKSEFLMRMSHEIRTPMYAVLGTLDLILDSDSHIEHRDLLVNAKLSAESLQGILNDILDFSKVEAQRLDIEFHEFSLRSVAESVMETLSLRAHEKNIELVTQYLCDVPDTVLGDSLRIRQILTNLVGNSLKFTSQGEIMLRVQWRNDDASPKSFLFEVIDSGIGIAQEKLGKIFDPFDQAEGFIARTYGGTGLGLAITKSLVELMGGTIWVESEIGKGSSFKFTLPLDVPNISLNNLDECQIVAEGEKALIVDDNQKSADTLKLNLEGMGFNVLVERDSAKAEELILKAYENNNLFGFIFLDYEMPVKNGLDILSQLPKNLNTRIVFMSNPSQLTAIQQAKARGAGHFLPKPYKLRDIWNILDPAPDLMDAKDILGDSERTDDAESRPGIESGRQIKILLAEDNAVNQRLIQRTLERKNFVVRIASNGMEAVEAIKAESFDLVLMDVQMPVMDGLSATRLIREHEKDTGKYTPIVAMTAHAFQQTENICKDAGMDYYFSKPISGRNLVEKIETILTTRNDL